MQCLAGCYDPRALGVLYGSLRDVNEGVRMFAGAGLAARNVRDGLAELIRLLDSSKMLSQTQPQWYSVLAGLEQMNQLNGWGFPNKEITDSARRSTGNRVQFRAVLITRWEEWFAENEQRFPEWKPGDPLPENGQDKKED